MSFMKYLKPEIADVSFVVQEVLDALQGSVDIDQSVISAA